MVSGVPLARGKVRDERHLALLDSHGRALPMQAEALARWPDGSIKWVLLTVPRFHIESGSTVPVSLVSRPPAPLAGALRLRKTAQGVHVSTGVLRFTVSRTGMLAGRFDVLSSGQWRKRAGHLDLRMNVEHNGRIEEYFASLDKRSIEIESAGPMRAVIAVRGHHRSRTGALFGPYVLRLEVLSNSRQVRLTHSVVYDGRPENDFVRSSEVVLTAFVGESPWFGFGSDDGHEARFERQRSPWMADYRYAELFQDSATHWRIRRWVDPERREVFCEEGLRGDGWVELSGRGGRVAVAVREFWQNHPKSLFADAQSGEIRIGLYPLKAPRLDLQRYSDRIYPMSYEAPCTWKNETLPFDGKSGAHGIRKTHDLALMFDEPNPSGAALAYNNPLRIQWQPEYLAATGVVVPATPRRDRAWLSRTHTFLDFLGHAMLHDGASGYLDYFDLPEGFNLRQGRWLHDYGGLGYNNNEGLPCLGLWQAYFLTGRADAFALARAMTRHVADIDSYHVGPLAGLGSRHNVNHWGDACKEPRISQPIDKRFLYYLTGDRSAMDLTAAMLAMWERTLATPAVLPVTAHVPALVSTLLTASETGMAAADNWLRALADALVASSDPLGRLGAFLEVDARNHTARPRPEMGSASYMMISCFGAFQTFAELAERLNHDPLRQALVRMARYQMLPYRRRRIDDPNETLKDWETAWRGFDLFAYAYQQTGDAAFVRHARKYARACCVKIGKLPLRRYGVEGTAQRPAPFVCPWPDASRQDRKIAKKYYPIPGANTFQLFSMAVYLHKMQGLMLLLTATPQQA